MEKLYTVETRPGADCGSDHEVLIAKFRLKLTKVGETTRLFGYDLNKIPYSGSDKLIQGIRSDRQSAWRTMDGGSWHCTGGGDQDHHQEKEMQEGKMVVWEGFPNSWEKKVKAKQKRKDTPIWMQSSKE